MSRDRVYDVLLWLTLILIAVVFTILSTGCASSGLTKGLQAGVVAAQAADIATTHMAISSGRGVEANPVLPLTWQGQLLVKAPVTAGVLWASTRLEQQGHPTLAKIFLASVAGSVAVISARNLQIARGR